MEKKFCLAFLLVTNAKHAFSLDNSNFNDMMNLVYIFELCHVFFFFALRSSHIHTSFFMAIALSESCFVVRLARRSSLIQCKSHNDFILSHHGKIMRGLSYRRSRRNATRGVFQARPFSARLTRGLSISRLLPFINFSPAAQFIEDYD